MLPRGNAIAYPENDFRPFGDPTPGELARDLRMDTTIHNVSEPSSSANALGINSVNPLLDNRWDHLVRQDPKASAFHQRGWLEALARSYGYQPVVFTMSSPTSPLENGLLFCRVDSWLTGSRLVSLPFSDHCEPLCGSLEEMDALISYVQGRLKDSGLRYVEVRPVNEDFGKVLAARGFQPAGSYFLHLMDLRPKLDELFRSFDKDCVQRRIRRAEKAGLVEQTGTSDRLLVEFYKLFSVTRKRHNLPPPPYLWFQNLARSLGKSLEIRLASKDERPIAAILTMRSGNVGYFKYGCSDARFHKLGATPWLLWKAIAAAKSDGALAFDMGRTQDDNAGLVAFKSHWVRRHQRLLYWRYPNAGSLDSAEGWKLRMAKRIFASMPERLLTATGSAIYRHIG